MNLIFNSIQKNLRQISVDPLGRLTGGGSAGRKTTQVLIYVFLSRSLLLYYFDSRDPDLCLENSDTGTQLDDSGDIVV